MMKTYIVLPDVQIHNANAMSSTYTIGFPAMTAWLGAVHALQRNLAVWEVNCKLNLNNHNQETHSLA